MAETLHDDELTPDEGVIRALLREQCPQWSELPLSPAGAGTDNILHRLGEELLLRLPRTPGTARSVEKEQQWLPVLAPHLPVAVPEPVHLGRPSTGFPLPWSVYRWIEGERVGDDTVADWTQLGHDLGCFVEALQAVDLMGAERDGELSWYRGGSLADVDDWVRQSLAQCRALEGRNLESLDLDRLDCLWSEALELTDHEEPGRHVWMHADLKPTNLLVRDGRLAAVIDFGGLTVGVPDAEHAPMWDLPVAAREAYRSTLGLGETPWLRARAWALAVALSGVAYYWGTYPAFVAECLRRLDRVLADAG